MIREVTKDDLFALLNLYTQLHGNPVPKHFPPFGSKFSTTRSTIFWWMKRLACSFLPASC